MTKDTPFLGIDFGTSQSSMAWFNPRTSQAEVIRNAEGEDKTPSVVYYGDGETLVGKPAEDLLENEHERGRILFSVKRHLAKRVRYALGDRHIRPVDVVADILRKLKRDAEEGHFREAVSRAVITHPAVFDQVENDLLAEAARAAGFAEVVLLAEPVAAAIAYAEAGLNVGDYVLVYDLGGGTFDLALLNRGDADDPFSLAAEPRGVRCGGDDFDQALYDHCDAIAQQTLGRPIGTPERRDLHFLRECRRRKENLSVRTRSEFSSYLSGGVQFKHAIDRESFERLICSKVQPTVSLTRTMMDEATSDGRQPKSVVLIGGSSQVPLVQRLLREALPIEPVKWQERDVAVALGAAYHGRNLRKVLAQRQREQSVKFPLIGRAPVIPVCPPPVVPGRPAGASVQSHVLESRRVTTDAKMEGIKGVPWRSLSLHDLITDVGLAHLKGLASLRSLSLEGCMRVTDAGLAYLKGLTALQSLHLRQLNEVTDAGLAHLKKLAALESLHLCELNQVTDAGLANLKELASLRSLSLEGFVRVTDAGLTNLKGLTNLVSLAVERCWQTDAGLVFLKTLSSLRSLSLECSFSVTDAGLVFLSGLHSLRSLSLRSCSGVTDAGLAHLKGLTALHSLDLGSCDKVTDGGLSHLKGLAALQSLDVSRCKRILGAGLSHLKGLTSLQSLDLTECEQVTDPGLAHLKELTALQSLNLSGCRHVTDAGLAHLKEFVSLRELYLNECKVTDAGLADLKGLASLLALRLESCRQVTGDGLAHLRGLSSLEWLGLRYCEQVTDIGLSHVKELRSLRFLSLHECWQVTDAGLAHLKGLTALEQLELSGCVQVTDIGLAHLKGLAALQLLCLERCTRVTDAGLTALRQALPYCYISS